MTAPAPPSQASSAHLARHETYVNAERELSAAASMPFSLVGSEEERQVEMACAKGGMKLAPAKDVLER